MIYKYCKKNPIICILILINLYILYQSCKEYFETDVDSLVKEELRKGAKQSYIDKVNNDFNRSYKKRSLLTYRKIMAKGKDDFKLSLEDRLDVIEIIDAKLEGWGHDTTGLLHADIIRKRQEKKARIAQKEAQEKARIAQEKARIAKEKAEKEAQEKELEEMMPIYIGGGIFILFIIIIMMKRRQSRPQYPMRY